MKCLLFCCFVSYFFDNFLDTVYSLHRQSHCPVPHSGKVSDLGSWIIIDLLFVSTITC